MGINTKEEILNAINNMKIIEICELIKMMEKKFNISAQQNNNEEKAKKNEKEKEKKEQTEFKVILIKIGKNKISTIKTVRTITGLGLKEAKDAVENTPYVIKEEISKEEANKIKIEIEKTGSTIELK